MPKREDRRDNGAGIGDIQPDNGGITIRTLLLAALCTGLAVVWALPGPTYWTSLLKSHSRQEQMLLDGGINHDCSSLDRARAVAEKFPGDADCYGNYINAILCCSPDCLQNQHGQPEHSSKWMAKLQRGRQIDPGNGFYPMLQAATLLDRACSLQRDEQLQYRMQTRSGTAEWRAWNASIRDGESYQQALDCLQQALDCGMIRPRSYELLQKRTEILLRRNSEASRHEAIHFQNATLPLAAGPAQTIASALCGRSIQLARQGRFDRAGDLLGQVERLGLILAISACREYELLEAHRIRKMAVGHGMLVAEMADDQQLAGQLSLRLDPEVEALHSCGPGRAAAMPFQADPDSNQWKLAAEIAALAAAGFLAIRLLVELWHRRGQRPSQRKPAWLRGLLLTGAIAFGMAGWALDRDRRSQLQIHSSEFTTTEIQRGRMAPLQNYYLSLANKP